MDRLKETQLTQRATRRPCEYNYTNADVHHPDVQPSDGYQFEYPVNWTGDPSTNKVIGLRRINYKATSVNLAFSIMITYGSGDTEIITIVGNYTSENTFEECYANIMKQINDKLVADSLNSTIYSNSEYDKDTGKFTLTFQSSVGTKLEYTFIFDLDASYNPASVTEEDFNKDINLPKTYFKREFLKLFNQPITKANVDMIHSFAAKKLEFNNVWNRDTFYCHASFSDSPRKIIGINKDFWMTPSMFYEYSDNSNDFNIFFTTDTVHRILPRNGVLLIQLSYIYNYQTSYLTY